MESGRKRFDVVEDMRTTLCHGTHHAHNSIIAV